MRCTLLILFGIYSVTLTGQSPSAAPSRLPRNQWKPAANSLSKVRHFQYQEQHFELALRLIREPDLPVPYQVEALKALARSKKAITSQVHALAKEWKADSFPRIAWTVAAHHPHRFPTYSVNRFILGTPSLEQLQGLAALNRARTSGQENLYLLRAAFMGSPSPTSPHSAGSHESTIQGLLDADFLRQAAEAWIDYAPGQISYWNTHGNSLKAESLRFRILQELHGDRGKTIPREARIALAGQLLYSPSPSLDDPRMKSRLFGSSPVIAKRKAERVKYWAEYQRYAATYYALKKDVLSYGMRVEHTLTRVATAPLSETSFVTLPDDLILGSLNKENQAELSEPALAGFKLALNASPYDVRMLVGVSRIYHLKEDLPNLLSCARLILLQQPLPSDLLGRYLAQLETFGDSPGDRKKIEEALLAINSQRLDEEKTLQLIDFSVQMRAKDLLTQQLKRAMSLQIPEAPIWAGTKPMDLAFLDQNWTKVERFLPWMLAMEQQHQTWPKQGYRHPFRISYRQWMVAMIHLYGREETLKQMRELVTKLESFENTKHPLPGLVTLLEKSIQDPEGQREELLKRIQPGTKTTPAYTDEELRNHLKDNRAELEKDLTATNPAWKRRLYFFRQLHDITQEDLDQEFELFHRTTGFNKQHKLRQKWTGLLQTRQLRLLSDHHAWPEWKPPAAEERGSTHR